ncbi:NgoPII family restriction endonuclease [Ligilactobacillus murinus]|nr:NgoPII family restriction endonuclease [Ligilactobacillus murinus]MBF0833401.1 NgoPII family restriction endonuclease [Ligilactobacillus murinus]TFU63433.1 NgoPII family restriction endonuclease [Ligilactobacillus murinus]
MTNFRIRGIWILENPFKVFSEVYSPNKKQNLICLL